MNAVFSLVLLASALWLTVITLGLETGLMACAALVAGAALLRVWKHLIVGALLIAAAWIIGGGVNVFEFFIPNLLEVFTNA